MAAAAQSEPIYILLCEAGGLMRNSVVPLTFSDVLTDCPTRSLARR